VPATDAAAESAAALVDVVPIVMRFIRREMRDAVAPVLTVEQLRTLLFVGRTPDVSLSALADSLGIGIAGASGLVDRLVRQGLIKRQPDPAERRRIQLSLTADGTARLNAAIAAARATVAAQFESLTADEAATVARAMDILRRQFTVGSARLRDQPRGERRADIAVRRAKPVATAG
jgi:DNA-binding MarR family transcriptional regulator